MMMLGTYERMSRVLQYQRRQRQRLEELTADIMSRLPDGGIDDLTFDLTFQQIKDAAAGVEPVQCRCPGEQCEHGGTVQR